ncbi:MAG: SpvB/TcaC N-terminal domain-containing protein [Candidatus Paceibacterota bacterium]|jgi:RHS repeat-associated protein|nr:hypothetical protein [Candidatus Paceibacterota bacterium]
MFRIKKVFVSVVTIINITLSFPLSQVFAEESISAPEITNTSSEAITPAEPVASLNLEEAIDSLGSGDALPGSSEITPIVEGPALETSEEVVSPSEDSIEPAVDTPLSQEETPTESESMSTLTGDEGGPRPLENVVNGKNIKTDELTGALVYEYPIKVPPGRNGMEPGLALRYNSQSKENSIFGYGWSHNIPYIERMNKTGTDKMFGQNYFTSSLDGELVQTSTSTYRAKVENGNFNSYLLTNNAWLITTKSGNTYSLGYSTSTRQDNPSDGSQIYKWMLEQVRDTNGNSVDYSYYKDAGQIYPSSISYTNNPSLSGIFLVEFLREDRNDVATSSVSGFSVATKKQIKEIRIKTNGEVTHRYVLSYDAGNSGLRSLLVSAEESGWDSSLGTTTLPAVEFGYSTSTEGWTENTDPNKWRLPGGHYFTGPTGGDGGGRVLDFNGDSLPDLNWSWGGLYPVYYEHENTGLTWATTTGYDSPELFMQPYDSGLRFVDLNGDGYVDEIVSRWQGASYKAVYLGSASGWSATNNWTPPVYFVNTNGFSSIDRGVRLVDVNGDGLTDITGDDGTYINNGSQFVQDTSWTFPTEVVSGGNDAGVRIVDLNNDGLADVLVSRDYIGGAYLPKHIGYLNIGHGWQETPSFVPPTIFLDGIGWDTGYRFADVNGDGFTDFVGSADGRDVYINTGSSWVEASSTFPTDVMEYQGGNIFKDLGVNVEDVNGDGLPDVIRNDYQNHYVWIKNGEKADLLNRITGEQGAVTTVEYANSAELADDDSQPNPNLQYNFTVVKGIATDAGFGGTVSTTTYLYSDGVYYHSDPLDKKFAGFAKITKTDEEGNVTKTYYHQGNTSDSTNGEYNDHISKINKPYRVEKYDDANNLYSLTVNKWDKYSITASSTFVKLVQSTEEDFDGNGTHKDKAEAYSHNDSTGNLSQKVLWGEVSGSNDGSFTDTGTDKATYAYSYAASSTNSVISLPSRQLVTDQSDNTVKDTKWYYDGLSFGYASAGNSTKEEKLISGSAYASTTKVYDGTYGLVTQQADPRGNATNYSYDTYDLFVATSTNSLGQTQNFLYDYSSGKVATTTDENGLVFAVEYDGIDRVVAEKQPDQTNPRTLVTKSAYTYTDTPLEVAVQKTNYLNPSLTNTVYVYKDGLGRTIQIRSQSEGSNTYAVRDVSFNDRGLIEKESLPYFASSTARTSATAETNLYATYTYDPLGRVTEILNAVGSTTNAYDDWKVTTTDARGKQKILTKDAYGNLVKVEEKNSGDTYTTNYEYNLLGNLTKITDALSNIRNFTYDKLGRRTTAEDLHASGDGTYGTWTYAYDDANNQTQSVDPKSQTVNYTFDELNRPSTEDYMGQSGTETTYTYDNCTNGKTRLCTASSTATLISYEYTPIGQTKIATSTISGTPYATAYDYDRQGNQTFITHPDGSQIKYTYNAANLIEKVEEKENGGSFSNVVSNFDYSPTGQPTVINYTNGVVTTNTYDEDHLYRLNNKNTSNGTIQNISYSYDENANITQIADASANTGLAKTINYTYDDLNRLLTASTTMASSTPFSQTFTYNAIGNISSSTLAGVYAYDGTNYANPHAVTSITANGSDGSVSASTPALDSTTTSISNGWSGSTTKTWMHTVTGTNPIIILTADIWQDVAGTGSISSATWNGGAFTKASSTRMMGMSSEIWYLFATTTGAKTMSVNITGDTDAIKLSASSFTNAAATSPDAIASATGTNGNPSTTLSVPNVNDIVVSTLSRFSTANATTSKTSLFKDFTGSTLAAASYGIATTTGNYTDIYTGSASQDWSMLTASFKPATTSTETIAFEATSTDSSQGVSSVTFSHTTGSGNNRMLVVGTSIYEPGTPGNRVVSGVTYNGASLTKVRADDYDSISGCSELWYLPDPASGSHNVVITLTGSVTNIDSYASTFTGVAQTGQPYSNAGANTDWVMDHSVSTSTVSGALVIDALNGNIGSFSIAAGQTALMNLSGGTGIGSYKLATSSGTYTMKETTASYDCAAHSLATFAPATTTTSGTSTTTLSYDANGNLTSDGTLAYSWDYKNRLIQSTSATSTSTYTYDHSGNRVKLTEDGTTTYFPNKYFNQIGTTGTITKHIFAGDLLVSTIESKNTQNQSTTTVSSIYSDSINGWDNWSWGTTLDPSNSSPVRIGTYSLKATHSDSWTGLYLHSSGVSTATSTHFSFSVRVPDADAGIYIDSYGPDGWLAQITLADYIPGGSLSANTWYDVDIPLADLSAASTTLTGFAGMRASAGTVYWDDIRLISSNGEEATATSTVRYIHTDHLGGTNVVTDQNGNLVEAVDYYPYGTMRVDDKVGSYAEKRKYTGTENDSLSGLNYMQARYYEGARGRFISQDPVFWEIGLTRDGRSVLTNPQAQNSYSYANGNPITNKDPNGRNPFIIAAGAAYVTSVTWNRGSDIYQNYQDIVSGRNPDAPILQARGEYPGIRYAKDATTAALLAAGVVGAGLYFDGLAVAGAITTQGSKVLTAATGGLGNVAVSLANGNAKNQTTGQINSTALFGDFLGGFIGTRIGQQIPNPAGRAPVSIGASLGSARSVTEQLRAQLGQLTQVLTSMMATLSTKTEKK